MSSSSSSSAKSNGSSSGPIFQSVKAYYLGLSTMLSNSATNALTKHKGLVIKPPPKVPSFFQKAAAAAASSAQSKTLPAEVTHVICDERYKNQDPQHILHDLNVDGPLPENVEVVTNLWLTQCLTQQKKVDTAPFRIDMTEKKKEEEHPAAAIPESVSPSALGKKKAPSDDDHEKENEEGQDANKRAKLTTTTTTATTTTTSTYDRSNSSLPTAPPLLLNQTAERITQAQLPLTIPATHEWTRYHPLHLLHLKVSAGGGARAATATAASASASASASGSASSSTTSTNRTVRIAAFDLDSTLIKTKSNRPFPQRPQDWQFFSSTVPSYLRTLYQQGYTLMIITNQRGVEERRTTVNDIIQRISAVAAALNVPLEAYCATHDNIFYKPRPGSWYVIEEALRAQGKEVDLAHSFYVGDAAGRPAQGKMRKKDHGDSDLKFAMNVGIGFKTPEELFLGYNERFHKGEVLMKGVREGEKRPLDGYLHHHHHHPTTATAAAAATTATVAASPSSSSPSHTHTQPPPPTTQEAILLIGPPAVGKTTYTHTHYPHHTRINQDTLKTLDKCRRAAADALAEGQSIVIDSTNTKADLRKEWVNLLRSYPRPSSTSSSPLLIKAVEFLPPETAAIVHLNCYRKINPDSTDPRSVPGMVLGGMMKNKEPVEKEREGFDEHVQVRGLVPGPFAHRREEHLFHCYLGKATR